MIADLLATMEAKQADEAVADGGRVYTYGEILREFHEWRRRLSPLEPGRVVSLEGEYSASSIAALLALVEAGHIAVPLSSDSATQHEMFRDIGSTEWRIRIAATSEAELLTPTGRQATHPLYAELRERRHPGLVLFSSGSTGQPKAAVHDFDRLLAKFRVRRHAYRTLVFLLLDHIGGINTLFYTLANGGAVVTSPRDPASVCAAIARHGVELLPTSPTFLNFLLLSGEYAKHDLRSLKLITYGTEPMPPSTLERLREALPDVKAQQTYGLTELGILRSVSRDPGSLWVKVGGEDFETKIVDDRLWIKARSAMLGYLNAPSPFDDEGYFDTGDVVEVDGEWVRFRGRNTDIINVGGNKVYPAEVESVLLLMPNVADAVVSGQPHALMGRIVAATVRLIEDEPLDAFKIRMRRFVGERLPAFKLPVRLDVTKEPLHSARFKRARGAVAARA